NHSAVACPCQFTQWLQSSKAQAGFDKLTPNDLDRYVHRMISAQTVPLRCKARPERKACAASFTPTFSDQLRPKLTE
ncbi:MAG: hypothetical protein KDE47_34940, partial [Caldilineaceae bacterium]|nr:hypothetical protein [Caldilineaceae bacterium]